MKKMQPLAVTAKTMVNACGEGTAAIFNALVNNQSGLSQQRYPGVGFDAWIGKVEGVEDVKLEPELEHFTCRNNQLAKLALDTDNFREAAKQAIARYGANRIGLFVGTSTSGGAETENAYQFAQSHDGVLPDNYQFMSTENLASLQNYVQQSLGLSGPGHTISTACSSSSKVFAAAYRHIASGQCDAAIVGGVDSLCMTTLYGFNSLQLISNEICRPYDEKRNGINIGEAGGFILLEAAESGHGKVKFKGYGESSDAYHMSSPHPEGDGAVEAMESAIARAGLDPKLIEYINLHGTATRNNDLAEAKGLMRVFGDDVICSSTKGFIGHTLGAAGITEAMISILALEKNLLPATLNLQNIDPKIDVKPLMETLNRSVENVMSNNFGFGGSNCSLVFGW